MVTQRSRVGVVRATFAVVCALGTALGLYPATAFSSERPEKFEVADYFKLHRIVELAMSDDGAWIAYATATDSLELDRSVRQTTVSSTLGSIKQKPVDNLSDATSLAWVRGSHRLAFISNRTGRSQLYTSDPSGVDVRQISTCGAPVLEFQLNLRGEIAYLTRSSTGGSPPLWESLRASSTGVRVDTDVVSMFDFMNSDRGPPDGGKPSQLWIRDSSGRCAQVPVPGDVAAFHWSPAGGQLSVTYIDDALKPSILRSYRTSLGVYSVTTGHFQTLGQGRAPAGGIPGQTFAGGEWIAHSNRLLVLRFTETHPWTSWHNPEWTITAADHSLEGVRNWWTDEIYPYPFSRGSPRFIPIDSSHVLVETTGKGTKSLFIWDGARTRLAEQVRGMSGSSSLFTFSSDRRKFAFVNESLDRPPEIYFGSIRSPTVQFTRLNESLAVIVRNSFAALNLSWEGEDGTRISGWLYKPLPDTGRPWPMITFVHGGPCSVYSDTFAPYSHHWPYPFEAYASHGIAVFVPNYRGTCTFGRAFQSPRQQDGEPLSDISLGIHYLIASGVADSKTLGISGHSHGAWLGPLLMTRNKIFAASSFAEGWSNWFLSSELMSGSLNREVQDAVLGATSADAPDQYVRMSPDLHFRGMRTANLFEAGIMSQAMLMLGMVKASAQTSVPNELIVYPRTGHVVTIPRLMEESANRNLDWFRFWLKGEENSNPKDTEQYRRWRAQKGEVFSRTIGLR
jgi:dipeptidyl aminopeptidase/acylaminoacyl peptidase